MPHPVRTTVATLATAALTAGVLAAPALTAPAAAAPTSNRTDDMPSKSAAKWLSKEFNEGIMVGEFGPDYGLTIDAGIAMSVAGGFNREVRIVAGAIAPKLGEYVGDGEKESYSGALGKAATYARVAGYNPTNYGGVNLITRLEDRVANADAGATAGRISDKSEFGDFANVIGQSYAVRALSLANSAEAFAARDYLLKQQCPSGYFRLNFAKADAADQTCADGAAGSEADPDATSLAIINLLESQDRTPAVQDSLNRAGAWLAARQRKSGAIRGAGGTAVINTNSTGLGGYALGMLDYRTAASKAAVWVRRLQPVDKYQCKSALSPDTGAVAYRKDAINAAKTKGITEAARDQWRRATSQAVLGLQYAPAAKDELRMESARKRGVAGSRPQFRAYGVAPGERACMQVKGDFRRIIGKRTGEKVVRKLQLPTGNRKRVAVLKVADAQDKTWIRVFN